MCREKVMKLKHTSRFIAKKKQGEIIFLNRLGLIYMSEINICVSIVS